MAVTVLKKIYVRVDEARHVAPAHDRRDSDISARLSQVPLAASASNLASAQSRAGRQMTAACFLPRTLNRTPLESEPLALAACEGTGMILAAEYIPSPLYY
jgi:hypothetical protein